MQIVGHVEIAPTPERMLKGEVEFVRVQMFGERTSDMAARDARATALDRWWRDQRLAPEGDLELARARYDAGCQLAQFYEATGLRQRETGAYEPRQTVEHNTHEDACDCPVCRQLGALGAYGQVVRMMQGRSLAAASAVVNLCCYDVDQVDAAALIRGLDLLVRHWGLD